MDTWLHLIPMLEKFEKARDLDGYVPKIENPTTGRIETDPSSGITVATGFDLGQHNEAELKAMGLKPDIVKKLRPFLGLKGASAVAEHQKNIGFQLTPSEALEIDKAVWGSKMKKLEGVFNKHSSKGRKFTDIPPAAQAAIGSLHYNIGFNPNRVKRYWKHVFDEDWPSTISELKNFQSNPPELDRRRKAEGEYLEQNLVPRPREHPRSWPKPTPDARK